MTPAADVALGDLPRAPEAYRATDHFIAQRRKRKPKPTGDVIRSVIENGDITVGNKPGTYVFGERIGAFEWRLPVAVPGDPPLQDHAGYALSVFALGVTGNGGEWL